MISLGAVPPHLTPETAVGRTTCDDRLLSHHYKPQKPLTDGRMRLHHLLTACLSFALLLTVIAFVRERKLRLALKRILNRLLNHWRPHAQKDDSDRDRRDRNRL